MHFPVPVFAADFDIVKLIIILIFFVGPILGKIFSAVGGGEKKPPPPRRPQPQDPGGQQGGQGGRRPVAAGPAGQGGREALEDEIETFLKQASQKAAEKQSPEPTVLHAEVIEAEPVRRPLIDREATAQSGRRGSSLGGSVADHVQEHIASQPVSERSAQLGKTIASSDERLESRLHTVFDHRLGSLASTSDSRAPVIDEGTDSAVWENSQKERDQSAADLLEQSADIQDLAGDPHKMRQAVLWAEILKRPDEREDFF